MEKQKRKRKKKVVKFNSPISINIGIVVFGLILVYILINAVILQQKKQNIMRLLQGQMQRELTLPTLV